MGKKPFVQRRSQLSLLCCTLWTVDKLRVRMSLEQRQNATYGAKQKYTDRNILQCQFFL